MAFFGLVRAVHAEAVVLSRAYVGQVAVPHLIRVLVDLNLRALDRVIFFVEETELDGGCVLREEGEVDTFAVPRRTEWVGLSGPDAHVALCVERDEA